MADVLKEKNYKSYDYTCRYSGVPSYYNSNDDKYIMGLTSNLKKTTAYTIHELASVDTLDSLALYYYNNPTLWWVLAYWNNIQDCFEPLLTDVRKTIQIPTINGIQFGDER